MAARSSATDINTHPHTYSLEHHCSCRGLLLLTTTALLLLALLCPPLPRAACYCLQEYHSRFGPVNPVELNDVFFGLHALLLSLLLAGQCLFYKRAPQQRLSSPTLLALGLAGMAAGGFAGMLWLRGEGQAPFTWLDLCYMCSFVKMGVTLVKYIPQV